MPQSNDALACQQLLERLARIEPRPIRGVTQPTTILETLRLTATSEFLSVLTQHTRDACESTSAETYPAILLEALAQCTRDEPSWRSLFGVSSSAESDLHPCILDVAREVLSKSQGQVKPSQTEIAECRSALRIIANCCADNNRNRRHFLRSQGLKPLLVLANDHEYLNLIIPVLYNVCSGDDDDHDTSTNQHEHSVATEADLDSSQVPSASFAAQSLANLRSPEGRFATFELLLSYTDYVEDDEVGYLAELIEISTSPAIYGLHHIFGPHVDAWSWSFAVSNTVRQTLAAAISLAQRNIECQLNVTRAVLYLLSQEQARAALLNSVDDFIVSIIRLADFSRHTEDELAEYAEEIEACEREHLQRFYELTGTPEFISFNEKNRRRVQTALDYLNHREQTPQEVRPDYTTGLPPIELNSIRQPQIKMVCTLIMMAQWSAEQPFKAMLQKSQTLSSTMLAILTDSEDQRMLYPLVMLISRLLIGGRSSPDFSEAMLLSKMKRLLVAKGLGLTIPFETVNVYRVSFKGRQSLLNLYLKDDGEGSIVSTSIELFDRTIEAGTKSEVGKLFIEILRTVFPSTKSMTSVVNNEKEPSIESDFRSFLHHFSTDTVRILGFVCEEAEPKEHRIHGWFGLGILSVWEPGRFAIIDFIEKHGLGKAILEISQTPDSPARGNLGLMLNNLRSHSLNHLSSEIEQCMSSAYQNLGLKSLPTHD